MGHNKAIGDVQVVVDYLNAQGGRSMKEIAKKIIYGKYTIGFDSDMYCYLVWDDWGNLSLTLSAEIIHDFNKNKTGNNMALTDDDLRNSGLIADFAKNGRFHATDSQKIDELKREIKGLKNRLAALKGINKGLESKLGDREDALDELKDKHDELVEDMDALQEKTEWRRGAITEYMFLILQRTHNLRNWTIEPQYTDVYGNNPLVYGCIMELEVEEAVNQKGKTPYKRTTTYRIESHDKAGCFEELRRVADFEIDDGSRGGVYKIIFKDDAQVWSQNYVGDG